MINSMNVENMNEKQRPLVDCGFGQAVSRFFSKYTQFEGRASRSEFWWAYLFDAIVAIIFCILAVYNPYLSFLIIIWGIGTIVPQLSLTCRRLHDAGFSGLFLLLELLVIGEIALLIMCMLPSRPERWKLKDF